MGKFDSLDGLTIFGEPPKMPLRKTDRFKYADTYLTDKSYVFFGEARFEPDYRGYFSIFHRALMVINYTQEEKPAYDGWLAMGTIAAVRAGVDARYLLDEEMEALNNQHDPAMHVISHLEHSRHAKFEGVERDIIMRDKVFASYALLAAGIHRDRVI